MCLSYLLSYSNSLNKNILLVDASNPHHHLYMDVDHYRKLYLTIIHRNMLRVESKFDTNNKSAPWNL